MLTAGTLDNYLADIERQAEILFEQTVKSLAEKENVTENLKTVSPMEWVRKMNNIRNRAAEKAQPTDEKSADCAFGFLIAIFSALS